MQAAPPKFDVSIVRQNIRPEVLVRVDDIDFKLPPTIAGKLSSKITYILKFGAAKDSIATALRSGQSVRVTPDGGTGVRVTLNPADGSSEKKESALLNAADARVLAGRLWLFSGAGL